MVIIRFFPLVINERVMPNLIKNRSSNIGAVPLKLSSKKRERERKMKESTLLSWSIHAFFWFHTHRHFWKSAKGLGKMKFSYRNLDPLLLCDGTCLKYTWEKKSKTILCQGVLSPNVTSFFLWIYLRAKETIGRVKWTKEEFYSSLFWKRKFYAHFFVSIAQTEVLSSTLLFVPFHLQILPLLVI